MTLGYAIKHLAVGRETTEDGKPALDLRVHPALVPSRGC